jgi:hypothetical protein
MILWYGNDEVISHSIPIELSMPLKTHGSEDDPKAVVVFCDRWIGIQYNADWIDMAIQPS